MQGKAYIQVVHVSAGEWPVDQLLGTSLNAVVDDINGLQRSSVHNLSRSRQQMEVVVPQPQELVQPERSGAWPRRGWQRCTCTAFCRLGRCSSGSLEYIEFEGRFGSLADVLCRSLLKIALILMILLSTAICPRYISLRLLYILTLRNHSDILFLIHLDHHVAFLAP